MDRAPLEPLLAGVQGPLQRCLPDNTPGLRLLDGYLRTLFALDQSDLALTSMHVQDLALSALGVGGDVQALVRERGVSAARQRVLLDHIAQHAGESGLDPAHVAAAPGHVGALPAPAAGADRTLVLRASARPHGSSAPPPCCATRASRA